MAPTINQQTITDELQQAYQAQKNGKDGLARVCARRAAGWAILIHLKTQGVELDAPSAMDHIKYLAGQEGNPQQVQTILDHLIQRVAKDSLEGESYWPLDLVDLVAEAHWFCEHILGKKLPLLNSESR